MKSLSFLKPAFLCTIAIAFSTLTLVAQSTKNVSLNNFTSVSVSAGIEMYITQGATESAKIVADDNLINEVEIKKSGNSISVGWKDEDWSIRKMWKNKNAKVYITYKKLNSIAASSGSSLRTENILKTDRLNVSVSSGSSLDAKISCSDLDVSSSSGATMSLAGTATNMKLESSSGSSVSAAGLVTEYARVNTSSGADVKISVNKALETTTSSGSNIRYKGNASLKNNSNSRSSGVSRIN